MQLARSAWRGRCAGPRGRRPERRLDLHGRAMVRAGFDQETVEATVRAHNAKHCRPPRTDEELATTMLRSSIK